MSPRGGARPGSGPKIKDPSGAAKMATFRLPPATIDAIREFSAADGVSQADLITRWVQRERAEREAPEADQA